MWCSLWEIQRWSAVRKLERFPAWGRTGTCTFGCTIPSRFPQCSVCYFLLDRSDNGCESLVLDKLSNSEFHSQMKDLPALDEFAQDNSILPQRLLPIIKLLKDKCSTLKAKLVKASQILSRPSSPTKSVLQPSAPHTPRRSPKKPLRDLPTRESMRKQRLAPTIEPGPSKTADDVAILNINMNPPETPTKKRKLNTLSPMPSTKRQVIFPPTTPAASHTTHTISMKSPSQMKASSTPAIPSPLRRSARFVLQQEVDAFMEVDEEDQVPVDVNRSLKAEFSKTDEDADENPKIEDYPVYRRFRPAYQDYKQWFARDARVLRMWKEASVVQWRRMPPRFLLSKKSEFDRFSALDEYLSICRDSKYSRRYWHSTRGLPRDK